MICWRYLLCLMCLCFVAGLIVGAAFSREIISLTWRFAP